MARAPEALLKFIGKAALDLGGGAAGFAPGGPRGPRLGGKDRRHS